MTQANPPRWSDDQYNLMAAQQAGLTIFWSHKLKPLGQFVR